MMADADLSAIERTRRAIGRIGYAAALLGLISGLASFLVGQRANTRGALIATVAILVALPVVNVLAILAEEIRKRDWAFVLVAVVVLALLTFNVARRLFG